MELVSVAALAENRVIGVDGELPWPSIPADKRQYRSRIADEPVILGRQTFDSMREDIPGRAQIVLSRSEHKTDVDTAHYVSDVEAALELAAQLSEDTAYVIGGGVIYSLFQPHLDRMVLSRVPGEYEGDSFYPEWEASEWTLVSETSYSAFTLEKWERQ